MLLSVLAYENKGGHIIRRLQEEIQREAQRSERDVTPIMMSLTTGYYTRDSILYTGKERERAHSSGYRKFHGFNKNQLILRKM